MATKRKPRSSRPKPFPNEGAAKLAEAIARGGITTAAAERLIKCSSGLAGRLIRGERIPGRALALKIERQFGVNPLLWDVPLRRTGTDG